MKSIIFQKDDEHHAVYKALTKNIGLKQAVITIFINSLCINLLGLVFPLILLQFYDRVIPAKAFETLYLLVVIGVVGVTVEWVLKLFRERLMCWRSARFEHVQGCELYQALMRQNPANSNLDATSLTQRVQHFLETKSFYGGKPLLLLVDLPFVLMYLGCIYWMGGTLALIPLGLLIAVVFTSEHFAIKIQHLFDKKRKNETQISSFLTEMLSGIKTVKSFAMESFMQRRYERLQSAADPHIIGLSQQATQLNLINQMLVQMLTVVIISCGSLLIMQGELTVGGLTACSLLSSRVVSPITQLTLFWRHFLDVLSSQRDVHFLSAIDPISTSEAITPTTATRAHGHIQLQQVRFGFNHAPVLFDDLNLDVPAKTAISISGRGSCGKTVLLKLMAGLYQPQAGSCLVDEHPIDLFQKQQDQQRVAYAAHDTPLYQGTLLQNLSLFDDRYVEKALALSQTMGLAKYIHQLPKGYDTRIEIEQQNQLPLSLERQIILIRSLVREPDVLLFDQLNSQVDVASDRFFVDVINQLKGQCTLVLVTHRPSLQRLAQRHYNLEGQRLIEAHLND